MLSYVRVYTIFFSLSARIKKIVFSIQIKEIKVKALTITSVSFKSQATLIIYFSILHLLSALRAYLVYAGIDSIGNISTLCYIDHFKTINLDVCQPVNVCST